ncbi:hypothetical protein KAR91_31735 [Candidatus Pacearchaeota archaeon]|nr:hypothetical protein [Candidatus Pacearchaeota archaeon]
MSKTRKVLAGEAAADTLSTARGFIEAVIKRLQARKGEYVPVKQGVMGKNKKGKHDD